MDLSLVPNYEHSEGKKKKAKQKKMGEWGKTVDEQF